MRLMGSSSLSREQKAGRSALGAQSLSHWTTGAVCIPLLFTPDSDDLSPCPPKWGEEPWDQCPALLFSARESSMSPYKMDEAGRKSTSTQVSATAQRASGQGRLLDLTLAK